jgi:hypothetical protein
MKNILSDPPSGILSVWEEYKFPICLSIGSLLAMILYGKYSD